MKYLVVISFEVSPDSEDKVFFAAHLFPCDSKGHLVSTKEVTLTANTPQEAFDEAMRLAWLLNLSEK